MAHAQKPEFVFRRNGRVHLNQRGCQFSRLLAAEVCSSAVVMLDTPRSEIAWRVLGTHSIRQFPLHLPSRASPCAITYQLESNSESTANEGLGMVSPDFWRHKETGDHGRKTELQMNTFRLESVSSEEDSSSAIQNCIDWHVSEEISASSFRASWEPKVSRSSSLLTNLFTYI